MAEQKVVICPYCGDAQALSERCRACGGLFEPLSRQATHNAMGPWFVRDPDRPFQPGCSYETLLRLVERGRVSKFTIVRGPTTRQFWTIAKRVPGLSHLLGYCHACDASVDPGDHSCYACGAAFGAYFDRNYLGLPEIQPLPWEADAGEELRRPVRQQSPMWRSESDGGEPRTISSFASDDELLGTGRDAGRPLPPSFGGGASAAAATQARTMTATAQPRDGGNGQPARKAANQAAPSRAARRRRILALSLAAPAVVGLIVLGAVLFPSGSVEQEAATEAQEPAATDAGPREAEPPPPALSAELRAGYERAAGLMEAAHDEQRDLTERIAEFEQALKLLSKIESEADARQWPTDLLERIETARLQLDRLRLREFFP